MTQTNPGTNPGRARRIRVTVPLCPSGLGLGTPIATTDGLIPVEFLTPGDRIITLDAGAVTLARTTVRQVPTSQVLQVRPAVLDPDGDGREVLIAARQRLLLRDWRARAMFGKASTLVEARKLVDGAHIAMKTGDAPVRLFQLIFDDRPHAIRLARGVEVISTRGRIKVPV